MMNPRQTSVRLLTALGVACLAAAFPLNHSAQTNVERRAATPNGKIVFQSTQGGDGFANDLYVMDADGKRQTRLTDDPADDASAAWSPQGDSIAFLSARRGVGYEIYLMNPDGSNQRLLFGDEQGGPLYTGDFEWSPDGSKIRFITDGRIYVAQVGDGAGPVQNLTPAGSFDSAASWSPDGSRIAFISTVGGGPDLFVMNADGSGRTPLTATTGAESNPRWVNGGARIAYDMGQELRVMNPDGTGGAAVSSGVGPMGGAVWSPDGSKVAFVVVADFRHSVYAANPDGSEPTLLTDVEANSGGRVFWSPDGSKVAFHNHNGTAVDLYVVSADGGRAANYTKTRRDDEFAHSWQKLAMP
jgi:TolB protein